jgi:hypothetical protein
VRLLALYALGAFAFWAAGVWELRYAFPAFGALCVVGGAVLAGAFRRAAAPGRLAWRFFMLGMCVLSWLATSYGLLGAHHLQPFFDKAPLAYLLGAQSRTAYLAANVDSYPAVAWMNAHLPSGAPVAYLWDERSYYSTARHIIFLPRNTSFPPPFTSPAAERAWLHGLAARYLFVNRGMLQLYVQIYGDQPAVRAYFTRAFGPFRARHLRLLYDDGAFQVYRIDRV